MVHFLIERLWSSGDEREELFPHGKVIDGDYRDML